MTIRTTRIPPLPIREWGDEQKQILMAFVQKIPHDLQGGHKEGATDYTALELLLNHPSLASSFLSYSNWLLQGHELAVRDRELAILRVSVLIKAEYEWAQHVLVAQHEDISDEEIRRVVDGPDAAGWSEQERFLLKAVDELVGAAYVGDETWQVLQNYYNTRQLMEIMFTVGTYHLMGMVYNTMGAPLNENLQATLANFPL